MGVAKSKRQLNDWVQTRKNKRARKLASNMTGKDGNLTQAIAVRFLRDCETWIPEGDCIVFRCESIKSDKQLRVWKRWFSRHESSKWEVDEQNKEFFFYRSMVLE